ncbi:MAG: HNH endonuclease signature motif containing protein, partial [Caldimonas sp.]
MKARIQGRFRSRVELTEPACRLTGVKDRRMLRASHIKPWAKSSNLEKLDGQNGLMHAPYVDHLF